MPLTASIVYWDNGKPTMLYRDYIGDILGLSWDNGKENGNYYNGAINGFRVVSMIC